MVGSKGERELQIAYNSINRAAAFYDNQVLPFLNDTMIAFIARQSMMFIATSDAQGNCDNSFRAGEPGFVAVLDEKTLVYPEYRGNGVYASLGNISENPHIGLLFVDFFDYGVGLHVNGDAAIETQVPGLVDPRAERFVRVTVEEAYIHCSKHIPLLARREKEILWGTDDAGAKGGDFFKAKVTNEALRARSQAGGDRYSPFATAPELGRASLRTDS